MDYKKAGVDIEAGYKSVELMKEHVKRTMREEVLGGLGGFSGAFSLKSIAMDDLQDYPYLTYEQGEYNSQYFSEEFVSTLDSRKNIRVRDRATLFNLIIGLNGYTVCSGVLSAELNGKNIISKPLDVEEYMRIGIITRKGVVLSRYAREYIEALKAHCI